MLSPLSSPIMVVVFMGACSHFLIMLIDRNFFSNKSFAEAPGELLMMGVEERGAEGTDWSH